MDKRKIPSTGEMLPVIGLGTYVVFDYKDPEIKDGGTGRGWVTMLAMGLAFIGQPTELEGQRAYAIPLRFQDGSSNPFNLRLGQLVQVA